ncbi:MutS-related protein [Mangrovibacterium marinum]|uniref:MutS-like protein n=1 Tax=Mangrovibacterium marinum TaxID=1639118 RepID=A0A2T5BYB0_9BACT|nr:hypothetical protein [Mangrovibacterium marinum]PTN07219.1 MutS-like protein [Mangrovibacterium marinum]
MNSRLSTYEHNLQKYEFQLKKLKQQQQQFFGYRILLFAAIVISLIYLPIYPATASGISFFALFLWIIRKNILAERKELLLKRLITINENEIKAIKGSFSHFSDGHEFIDSAHPYSFDLDVFGQGSLFQFLNRTTTPLGKQKLANFLKQTETKVEKLLRKQQAVAELEDDPDWGQQFATHGYLDNEKDLKLLEQFSENDHLRNPRKIQVLISVIPFVSVIAGLMYLAGIANWSILLLLAAFNGTVLYFSKKTIAKYYYHFGNQAEILQKYLRLIQLIEAKQVRSADLTALKSTLKLNDQPASAIIQQLQGYLSKFDYRKNLLFIIVANTFFLWDLIYVYKLNRWHLQYHRKLQQWIDSIATFDALLSLSAFNFNHPEFATPTFTDDEFCMDGKNLAHPLIRESGRIGNDFSMTRQGQLIILTGANMAGKSTFLRTIGINLILAVNGCRCCADSFNLKPVRIFTNMRTTDNLMKAESYFHAELLRLQAILNQLKSGVETFVLIDEMLKGTNSEDKLEGSKELTRQLVRLKANGIISTHDLKLTELHNDFPKKVLPLCFEVSIENDQLVFDYRLRSGVTKTMNAIFLMRKNWELPTNKHFTISCFAHSVYICST